MGIPTILRANIDDADIKCANGQILVGNASGVAEDVAMSGDITISNTGVTTIGAAKVDDGMITCADTQIMVGQADGAADAKAVSGDATLANTGALSISAVLDGGNLANVADDNTTGGLVVLHRIDTAGGATANADVTLAHKTRILDAWVVLKGSGTTGDTVQIKNGTANAVTDAMDISGSDKAIVRAGEIDDAQQSVAASGTLRVTETDGGGTDSPACSVYVLACRVA